MTSKQAGPNILNGLLSDRRTLARLHRNRVSATESAVTLLESPITGTLEVTQSDIVDECDWQKALVNRVSIHMATALLYGHYLFSFSTILRLQNFY